MVLEVLFAEGGEFHSLGVLTEKALDHYSFLEME